MHKWLKGKTCQYYAQVVKRLKILIYTQIVKRLQMSILYTSDLKVKNGSLKYNWLKC